jgi:hypothetical protein
MAPRREENPFVFGEVVSEQAFVDRTDELDQVVRDMGDRGINRPEGARVTGIARCHRPV